MYDPKLGEGVSFKFDKSERPMDHDNTPGPGHYYIPVKIADVPRYNLKEQNEQYKWV